MTVISALTAQNTQGVFSVHTPDAAFIEDQLNCIFEDIRPDAIKIGMLANASIIKSIAARLRHYDFNNIVLDPVIVSTSGHTLLDIAAVDTLKTELLPLAKLITPNLPESAFLSGENMLSGKGIPTSKQDMLDMGHRLAEQNHTAVLLKGGHLADQNATSPDLLINKGEAHWFDGKRINTRNTHGTGCTLSAAICSHLAEDENDLIGAISKAKTYLSKALMAADTLEVGSGAGPCHHFVGLW